ncbi:hypothetical protein [Jiangella alkaliphila]|uniref:Uncharacterized protein n=1 Tax=Jiangella alkaliphila TaxID=419479 RepID=A0A1H2IF70_9ACTN|nr:hypothetical protein [Jiangella alkaliphila]SDU42635.1 hypothetical protein SAMN04488563_1661 [Jiangella alkaliphila]
MDVSGIVDGLVSHAAALGHFERVNTHEPQSPPGNGLHCAIWADDIGPARNQSGLNRTSVRAVFMDRIYGRQLERPEDEIDPNMLRATDDLMGAYSGDFTLGGRVRSIDLLGQSGTPLSAKAGYVKIADAQYRVMTITVPMIINDVWEQVG